MENLFFWDSVLIENHAFISGGALFALVVDKVFSRNTSFVWNEAILENGGAIYGERIDNFHVYDDNLFEGNYANMKGGAIYAVNCLLFNI
jgi:predicted outer membrane repeat protein